MPLVNDYSQVNDTYAEAAELGVALPVFCAEDRETLEAILAAGAEIGREIGTDNLPVIPAWTSRYPPRGQMTLLTACGDPVLGTRLMFSDLEHFTDAASPYGKLRVMPHLDHAFPWLDHDVLDGFAEMFASVMCDASEKPFEENIRLTAEYVDKVGDRVVVEGAVDEVFDYGSGHEKNEPTTIEQAVRFTSETGVDIIVPNVGTEHRATAETVLYRSDRARELSAKVGKIMCLHGTSSVKPEDLPLLPEDGFIKINVYTTLAVHGGQALVRKTLSTLGNVFSREQLSDLIREGVLGQAVVDANQGDNRAVGPKLEFVANPPRRDAWFGAVKERCKDFLRVFNYARYAR